MICIAPMEGVMDWRLRQILTDFGGVDRAATEFVRVTDQLLPDSVFHRYSPELKTGGRTRSGVPVFVQLLGGQPDPMGENAAKVASLGAPGIDLNFGCPAKTVNRHDGGASLLKNPSRVRDVTESVRRQTPAHIPVTAKVRLGFEHKEFAVEIAQAAEAGGASLLTIHARTKLEMYQPPAHWEYIGRMRQAVKIPVVANGDIWTVEDFHRCRQITGCDSVALGRALVARPDLARQIQASLLGRTCHEMLWPEVRLVLQEFFQAQMAESERLALARTKQWCKFLARSYPQAAIFFERIKTATQGPQMSSHFQQEDPWPPLQSTLGPSAPTASAPSPC